MGEAVPGGANGGVGVWRAGACNAWKKEKRRVQGGWGVESVLGLLGAIPPRLIVSHDAFDEAGCV